MVQQDFPSWNWDVPDNDETILVINYTNISINPFDRSYVPLVFDINILNNQNSRNRILFTTTLTAGSGISEEWTFSRDDNTQVFDGGRTLSLQVGHWQILHHYGVMNLVKLK